MPLVARYKKTNFFPVKYIATEICCVVFSVRLTHRRLSVQQHQITCAQSTHTAQDDARLVTQPLPCSIQPSYCFTLVLTYQLSCTLQFVEEHFHLVDGLVSSSPSCYPPLSPFPNPLSILWRGYYEALYCIYYQFSGAGKCGGSCRCCIRHREQGLEGKMASSLLFPNSIKKLVDHPTQLICIWILLC